MKHTTDEFVRPDYADLDIADVVDDWMTEMAARPVSPHTLRSYSKAMLSFTRSLALHNQPPILASLTEANVSTWRTDMRQGKIASATRAARPSSPATIRGYVTNLKVFTNKWLKRRYTHHDLLDLVEKGTLHVEMKEGLNVGERAQLLAGVDGQSFEDVRDRAFMQLLLATGCRFKEIHGLTTNTVDLEAKRIWVTLKGGRQVPVDIDGRALRDFKLYLGRRRLVVSANTIAIWVSDGGKPLSYWGGQAIFKRLGAKSNVKCNPHKFRHTMAQTMAKGGAAVADIQAVLHHSSDVMSKRYMGNARMDVEAGLAKKWSLAE